MNRRLTKEKKMGIHLSSNALNLPDWGVFSPDAALRRLQKLYKDERGIIDGLSARRATVSEIFLARAPVRREIIQLLGELFHLERVAKVKYSGISGIVRRASTLITDHAQYLSLQSKYPEMIRRLSRGSLSKLSPETQWYFSREVSEFVSAHSVKGKMLRDLSLLETELATLERKFAEKEEYKDTHVVRMIDLRAKIAHLSGYSSWNERELKGLTMSHVGPQGISAFLSKIKLNVSNLQSQTLEEYSESFSTPRYTVKGAVEGIEEILRRDFGMRLHPQTVSVWAKDVLFFEVYAETGELVGGIYVDLWSRKGKIKGAWSGAVRDGEKDILPLSMVVTGFTPGEKISHYEFITLIHEFGHAVHYLLSRPESYLGYVRYLEDDAVEIAGRFFERFSFDKSIVRRALLRTKEVLSKKDSSFVQKLPLFQRSYLVRDRSFDIAVSLFDWDIHLLPPKNPAELHSRWESVRDQLIGETNHEGKKFPFSLRYVFGGSHSAKFLIYIWADIIAAQLYEKYLNKRKISSGKARNLLREIFQKGSSAPMMETLRPLFGSRVNTEAYLNEIVRKRETWGHK